MNVRIIDPGKSTSLKPRQWGQSLEGDELRDLDEPQAIPSDDRLELLVDLRMLQYQFLVEGLDAVRLPEILRARWTERVEEVRGSIGALERLAGNLGLEFPPARPIDLSAGFADLAGRPEGGVPFATIPRTMGAVLLLNALGLAVVSAFLREEDESGWRAILLPMLADDSRFEGALKGHLAAQGAAAEVEAGEWLLLASGVGSGPMARLWSFDLLRMGIRRLLGRGFFPVG